MIQVVRKMTDHESSVEGWGAVLHGDAFDLEDWAEMLRPGFDPCPWVTRIDALEGGQQFVLRSKSLDGAQSPGEAKERADQIIAQLSGAMRISGSSESVVLGKILSFHRGGGTHGYVLGTVKSVIGRVRSSAVGVVIGRDGKIKEELPKRSEAQIWYALGSTDGNDLVSDALAFFARADDWFDLYKAYETVCAGVGGPHDIWKKNWATRDEDDAFRLTANYYRHARKERPVPLLTLRDGQNYVRGLLRRWLSDLAQ